jgi:endo-1,4-beta-xylanase
LLLAGGGALAVIGGGTAWWLTSKNSTGEAAGLPTIGNDVSAKEAGSGGTSTPPTTPVPTQTTPPAGGSGSCAATASIASTWTGGFTENVTVRNTGTAAISGWQVTWTWPSGQSITSIWSAANSGSGSSVSARNLAYNGSIAAGSSTSFGFQGTGNAVVPAVTCSVA